MSPLELKTLQQIHKLMLELERTTANGSTRHFTAENLRPLQLLLATFVRHEDFELRKVSDIAKHLSPTMTMKHYVSWIVPVERLLQKQLRDDEFLIHSEDGRTNAIEKLPMAFVLHNIRSAFNVGSIFRTAECFGAQKIYLCGYTPLPTQEKLAKTAMGTDSLVEWEESAKILELISKLKAVGYLVVALETTSHAIPLETKFANQRVAFVVGNERFGLDAEILELCDEVREIPLRGEKNSLNVGVAVAIAAYEFARQYGAAEELKS